MKNAFPIGTRLEFDSCQSHFTVLEILGRGSRTITYLCSCTDCFNNTTHRILKEYCPSFCNAERDENGALICDEKDRALFEQGKQRFCQGAACQSELRTQSGMINQTPLLLGIHHGYNTCYLEVVPFEGIPLDQLKEPDFVTLIRLMISITKLIGSYHRHGYLCLDLKPQNIFVLTDGQGQIITEMIEYIDFDSIRRKEELKFGCSLSFTRDWAAPEQSSPYSYGDICEKSDIYTLAEILFHFLFQRHSRIEEHRMFARFPFDQNGPYQQQLQRLPIRNALTELFSHTLRPSLASRYSDIQPVLQLLQKILDEAQKQEYIFCPLPVTPPVFIGRTEEIRQIHDFLTESNVLFVVGMGGIGKTTLMKNYCQQVMNDYDSILMLNYSQSLIHTFADDSLFFIQHVSAHAKESEEEYFERKLRHFRQCCAHKRVLIIIDQMDQADFEGMERLMDQNVDLILVSRTAPPSGYYPQLTLGPLLTPQQRLTLFETHLQSRLTPEQIPDFLKLQEMVRGHTLILELIARQIHCAHLTIREALILAEKCGFSRISEEKIGYIKDNHLSYRTLNQIILSLFDLSHCTDTQKQTLALICCSAPSALQISDLENLMHQSQSPVLSSLESQGWIQIRHPVIRMHPVIVEALLHQLQDPSLSPLLNQVLDTLHQQLQNDRKSCSRIPFLKESPQTEAMDHQLSDARSLSCSMLVQLHRVPVSACHVAAVELICSLLLSSSLDKEDQILDGCRFLLGYKDRANRFSIMKIYDLIMAVLCQKQQMKQAEELIPVARKLMWTSSCSVRSVYYDMMGTYYDTLLQGDYFLPEEENRTLFHQLLTCCEKAAFHARLSRYPGYTSDLIRHLLSQANLKMRNRPDQLAEVHALLKETEQLLDQVHDPLQYCTWCSTMGWYFMLNGQLQKSIEIHELALRYATESFVDDLEIIDRILIPYADALLMAGQPEPARQQLNRAIALCDQQEELLPYRRKKEELVLMREDTENS